MAVKIRLKRTGRRHRPFYRLAAMDTRGARDGTVIEELGLYDPLAKNQAQQLHVNRDRIEYWLGVGAQPTETVRSLLKRSGIGLTSAEK
jgi:small subunit ribosomal protein S16